MNNNTWDKGRGGGICHKQVRYQHLHIPGDALLEMQWRQHTPNTQLFKWKFAHFCRCCTFHAGIKCIEISRFYMTVSVVLSCAGRTHDPDTRLLQLLQWRGVPRRMERRQDRPATLTCPSSIHSATIACMFFNAINTRMHVSHSHVNVTLALDSCNEALAWSED